LHCDPAGGVAQGQANPKPMTEHQSTRTLVKSAPELWAECSDAASLARHLGAFGEIRITKLEPETAVAWEGTAASGTVRLEPSGWGTRVTLTVTEEKEQAAQAAAAAADPEPVADAAPEPVADAAPEAPVATPELPVPPRAGMMGRLRLRFRRRPVAVADGAVALPEPEVADEHEPEPQAESASEPTVAAPDRGAAPSGEDALAAALESLGRAHHRPYSRA